MKQCSRIFFLISITLNVLLGQDLIDLYDDILSDKIMKNPVYKMQINSRLESNAKLNPQFIYYVLENAIYYFDYGIRNSEENYAQDLTIQSFKMKEKINKWRSLQQATVEKNVQNKIHQQKINYYLDQFEYVTTVESLPFDITLKPPADTTKSSTLNMTSESSKLKINQNKMNFYMLRYLSMERGHKYDGQTDYLTLVTKELEKLIDSFNDKYERVNSLSTVEKDLEIEKAIRYPYLFAGTFIENLPKTTNFQLHEFIKEMTAEKTKTQSTIGIQLLNSLDILNTVSGRFNYVESLIKIDDKVSVKLQNGIYIGASYTIPLKEQISSFSTVKIDAGYAVSNFIKAKTNVSDLSYRYIYDPRTGNVFQGGYKVDEGDHELTSYYIRIYSPFFYFTDNFYFEAGVGYFYNDVSINYKIDYYNIRADLDYPDKDVFSFSEQQHLPGIVLNINYKLTKNLLLKLDSFIPMQHIICLEYSYRL